MNHVRKYINPNYDPNANTRLTEIVARLRLSFAMLRLAWYALQFPSVAFSAMFFNLVREEGDSILAKVNDTWTIPEEEREEWSTLKNP